MKRARLACTGSVDAVRSTVVNASPVNTAIVMSPQLCFMRSVWSETAVDDRKTRHLKELFWKWGGRDKYTIDRQ
jgi:hypothetical protein